MLFQIVVKHYNAWNKVGGKFQKYVILDSGKTIRPKQAKIKASAELDNMLNISDYQYSSNDDGRHRFAKDGWDYYKTVFEVNGVKFEGLVNIAKSGKKNFL